VSGAQDSVWIANLPTAEKARILESLRSLDADYVMVDLGAGTTRNTIDFFLAADIQVVTLLPEPTSIENAYRFIKSAYYRKLYLSRHLESVRDLIEAAMDSKNDKNIRSPSDLFREVNRVSPEAGMRLKEEIEKFKPKLLLNQARTQTDVDIGFSVKTVCKKYFGIEMDYIGYLDYDSAQRMPFLPTSTNGGTGGEPAGGTNRDRGVLKAHTPVCPGVSRPSLAGLSRFVPVCPGLSRLRVPLLMAHLVGIDNCFFRQAACSLGET
jgi:MinD-like ATPase involved in chromosome partitioning or flagellar assembly